MFILILFLLSLILLNLYGDYLIKDAFEGFGDFKIGQVIRTVKYVDHLVLLPEKEAVLHGMI
jgi:hypothetical protein